MKQTFKKLGSNTSDENWSWDEANNTFTIRAIFRVTLNSAMNRETSR